MSKILPFEWKPARISVQPNVKHYTLKDDALSVNGEHPLRGDICSVQLGTERAGELHMVRTDSGRVLCGFLSRNNGVLCLTFPNSSYPAFAGNGAEKVIGVVLNFFFKVEDAAKSRFKYSAYAHSSRLADSVLGSTSYVIPPDSIVNWRADIEGRILFASDNARIYFPADKEPTTWSYIEFVHPNERERVRRQWMRALAGRRHFNVLCEALTNKGYQLVRNMALPVHNQQTKQDEWIGTLHLLGQITASGTTEVMSR